MPVIEVNTAMKRTGKFLSTDFSEATLSKRLTSSDTHGPDTQEKVHSQHSQRVDITDSSSLVLFDEAGNPLFVSVVKIPDICFPDEIGFLRCYSLAQ